MGEIIPSIVVAIVYTVLAISGGLLVSVMSMILVLVAVWILEKVPFTSLYSNPHVRYCLMLSVPFSIAGVSVGIMTGISRASAVGTVVPSVLTLIAAASTYLYTRAQKEALVAFVAVISISIAMVFGTSMGAALRPV